MPGSIEIWRFCGGSGMRARSRPESGWASRIYSALHQMAYFPFLQQRLPAGAAVWQYDAQLYPSCPGGNRLRA